MKKLFYFTAFLFCAVFSAAQNAAPAPAIQISDMDIKVEILADIAITRYDITFYNLAARGFEADFVKENKNIISFTLDIDEKLPCGASRAQITIEEKLKKDDGRYLYFLPLGFGREAKTFSLRIDALRQDAAPEIKDSPLEKFRFAKWDDSYTASFKANNYKLSGGFNFAVPAEDIVKVYTFDAGGNTYFFAAVPVQEQNYILQSITYDKSRFEDVYPSVPVPAQDMVAVAGILTVKDASMDLNFTLDGKPAAKKRIYINKKRHNSLARGIFWQEKIASQN